MSKKKKKAHLSNLLKKSNKDPKKLFDIVNTELDRHQVMPLPESENIGELTTGFNNFFVDKIKKIRTSMDFEPCPDINTFSSNCFLSEFKSATTEEIKSILNEMSVKSSPDDILPSKLLKDNMETWGRPEVIGHLSR